MDYLLDTNIIVHLIRNDDLSKKIIKDYQLFKAPQRLFVSVVTLGELESIALQNEWGFYKLNELENYSRKLLKVDVRNEAIYKRYAEIDAFSQGNLRNRPLNLSARNMGKNDLWIAACTSVLDISLITTDNDFNHLDKEFIKLIKVKQISKV